MLGATMLRGKRSDGEIISSGVYKINLQFCNMFNNRKITFKGDHQALLTSTFLDIVREAYRKIWIEKFNENFEGDGYFVEGTQPWFPEEKCLLLFDRMNLEYHATPLSIGHMPGDLVLVVNVANLDFGFIPDDADALAALLNLPPLRPRLASDVANGLNCLLGDPPLPIINGTFTGDHDHPTVESERACRDRLNCIETVLFQAFDMTIETFPHPLPVVLPDFSKIRDKLRRKAYKHADDCMRDIHICFSQYQNRTLVLNSRYKEDAKIRKLLQQDLGKTMAEFQHAIQTYQESEVPGEVDFGDYFKKAADSGTLKQLTVLVGPVRDFDQPYYNMRALPPTMALTGLTNTTTVGDLLNSYQFFLDDSANLSPMLDVRACLQDCRPIQDTDLVVNLIPETVLRLGLTTFNLPLHSNCWPDVDSDNNRNTDDVNNDDGRDVDALVEFIEGGNGGKQGKKKKRKGKRKSATGGSEPTLLDEEGKGGTQESGTGVVNGAENCDTEDGAKSETLLKDDQDKGSTSDKLTEVKDSERRVERAILEGDSQSVASIESLLENCNLKLTEDNKVQQHKIASIKEENSDLERRICDCERQLVAASQAAQLIIDQNHRELSHLQKQLEAEENTVSRHQKEMTRLDYEVGQLEARIADLERDRSELCRSREQLRQEVTVSEEAAIKYRQQRLGLEREVEEQLGPVKLSKIQLSQEILSLKSKLQDNCQALKNISHLSQTNDETKIVADANPLLDFINEQIFQKEKDLECPVCLETASPPIYMCLEQHLICDTCWDKVATFQHECVICRCPYPTQPKRHRYMEKAADELQILLKKRQTLLGS